MEIIVILLLGFLAFPASSIPVSTSAKAPSIVKNDTGFALPTTEAGDSGNNSSHRAQREDDTESLPLQGISKFQTGPPSPLPSTGRSDAEISISKKDLIKLFQGESKSEVNLGFLNFKQQKLQKDKLSLQSPAPARIFTNAWMSNKDTKNWVRAKPNSEARIAEFQPRHFPALAQETFNADTQIVNEVLDQLVQDSLDLASIMKGIKELDKRQARNQRRDRYRYQKFHPKIEHLAIGGNDGFQFHGWNRKYPPNIKHSALTLNDELRGGNLKYHPKIERSVNNNKFLESKISANVGQNRDGSDQMFQNRNLPGSRMSPPTNPSDIKKDHAPPELPRLPDHDFAFPANPNRNSMDLKTSLTFGHEHYADGRVTVYFELSSIPSWFYVTIRWLVIFILKYIWTWIIFVAALSLGLGLGVKCCKNSTNTKNAPHQEQERLVNGIESLSKGNLTILICLLSFLPFDIYSALIIVLVAFVVGVVHAMEESYTDKVYRHVIHKDEESQMALEKAPMYVHLRNSPNLPTVHKTKLKTMNNESNSEDKDSDPQGVK